MASLFIACHERLGADVLEEAGALAIAEGGFDETILAGVEGDDRRSSARFQGCGDGREKTVEVVEFAVDEDAQGLKRARRGVEFGAGGALKGEVAGLADDGGELLGGGNGGSGATFDNQPSDLRGVLLIAKLQNRIGEFGLGETVDERGGGLAAAGIHAHVEGPRAAVGEAASGVIDLCAGDADVGEDGVYFFDACSLKDCWKRGEVVVVELEAHCAFAAFHALQNDACGGDVGGVEVDGDEAAVGLDALENRGGMAAEAEGAIDDGLAGLGIERGEGVVEEDGGVAGVEFGHGSVWLKLGVRVWQVFEHLGK